MDEHQGCENTHFRPISQLVQRGQIKRSQTAIQNCTVDVRSTIEQLLIRPAQIWNEILSRGRFQNANATHDTEAKACCKTTGSCSFTCTQAMLRSQQRELSGVRVIPYFNPRCSLDITRAWTAGANYSHFAKNFRSDNQVYEEFGQDVERSDFGERDERRRVRDNGHSFSLRATVWSCSQSS